MLKGVNDSIADAKELVRLLAKIPAKINLIPFNPWPGAPYECSDWEQIEKFGEVVNRAGYASPVRSPRGRDIMAACGQLKSASIKQRASERLRLAGLGALSPLKRGFEPVIAPEQLIADGEGRRAEQPARRSLLGLTPEARPCSQACWQRRAPPLHRRRAQRESREASRPR